MPSVSDLHLSSQFRNHILSLNSVEIIGFNKFDINESSSHSQTAQISDRHTLSIHVSMISQFANKKSETTTTPHHFIRISHFSNGWIRQYIQELVQES